MPQKYIVNLKKSFNFPDLGREGFERKILNNIGLKSPNIFFINDLAFRELISELGFHKEIKKGLSFDEREELKESIQNSKLPENIINEIEKEFELWKIEVNHPLVEIRLANVDGEKRYLEKVSPIILNDIESFIKELKRQWIHAISKARENILIQVTEIPNYDISGMVYVDRDYGSIEINCLNGLWINGYKESIPDIYFGNIEKMRIEKFIPGKQSTMLVRSGKGLEKVRIGGEWQKGEKLNSAQIEFILGKCVDLSNSFFRRSFEFSFGIINNKLFIHDFKSIDDEDSSEYFFTEDFFSSISKQDTFQNEIEAISELELPFFLTEDITAIENVISKYSVRSNMRNILKKELTIRSSKIVEYKKMNSLNETFDEHFQGYFYEFEIFLRTINNLKQSSPSTIYNIYKNSFDSIKKYFGEFVFPGKEVVLQLSSLSEIQKKNYKLDRDIPELKNLREIGLEILLFKKISENRDHQVSLCLPPLRSIEEMTFVTSILKLTEINSIKNNKSMFYVDLSVPSLLFEYSKEDLPKKYLLDGVVIDFSFFLQSFFNKNTFSKRDYRVGIEYLKTNLLNVKNKFPKLLIILDNEYDFEMVECLQPTTIICNF